MASSRGSGSAHHWSQGSAASQISHSTLAWSRTARPTGASSGRTERGANGYRTYDESTLARLRFINAAQAAGLTLSDIRSIIDLRDDGIVPCAHVVALIDTRLRDVQARIRRLAALQAELEALLEHSHLLDPADCATDDICHVLSSPT